MKSLKYNELISLLKSHNDLSKRTTPHFYISEPYNWIFSNAITLSMDSWKPWYNLNLFHYWIHVLLCKQLKIVGIFIIRSNHLSEWFGLNSIPRPASQLTSNSIGFLPLTKLFWKIPWAPRKWETFKPSSKRRMFSVRLLWSQIMWSQLSIENLTKHSYPCFTFKETHVKKQQNIHVQKHIKLQPRRH